MTKSNYEVEVLINGKPVKEYIHDGKVYIEGRKETRFSLRLRNNSWQRKLFIPSIDGLSVMNGEECSFDSSVYIVKPYSSVTIDGWRVSDSEVAEFYFSSSSDSYRKRMGKGNNLGVIGVAVFSEKYKMPIINSFYCNHSQTEFPRYTLSSATALNNASLSTSGASVRSMSQDLGTGWGESKRSEVVSVEFDRENHEDTMFEIFYNTREQLQKLGINFKREPLYVTPQSFPGQFCKPPKY